MAKNIYVIATMTHFVNDSVEFKISQEAYTNFRAAQDFCLDRQNVYQIDDFHFCSEFDEGECVDYVNYEILVLTLV